MVKVKEFGCGFSLRSGTYIVAWSLLVWNFCIFVLAMYHFLFIRRFTSESIFPLLYLLAYDVTRTTIGMTVSLIAIWALQKNKSKFLSGLLWYLYFSVTYTIFKEILLIFAFDVARILSRLNLALYWYLSSETSDAIALIFLIYLCGIGAASYFALIVRSYRDYSLRNEAHNVQFVGPDATTVGYITA